MATEHWQIRVRDNPTKRRPPPQRRRAHESASGEAMLNLLEAFGLLAQRGSSGLRWAAPFRHEPIAFLLDTISDAANLWSASGELLYRNRAAEALDVGHGDESAMQEFDDRGRRFERRCMRCDVRGTEYMLEVIRQLPTS